MTTAGSSGAPQGPEGGAPQDDDPFGYLYRPADGASGQPAEPQQGVPRTPYSRPMEVGRAQYGQPPRQQQPYPPQQQGYPQAQPQQPYPAQADFGGAPTQQTRYAEHSRPQPGEERPSSGRGKGAVIGAVAVVAAVAIGAAVALTGGDADKDKSAKGGSSVSAPAAPGAGTGTAGPGGSASATPSATASGAGGLGTVDASQLQAQNAPAGNTVKGAKSSDGSYLTLNPGGTVTWSGDLPTAGTYKFTVHYSNAAGDVRATATVNGKDWPGGLGFKNYSPGKDPASSWFNTYITPPMQAGPNSVVISLPPGSGTILVDQVVLEAA
ncbi:hypothetical protein ACFP3U_30235 [Kitasatospora misakiensis]|uniref:CBM6 domain-containing protein n=1 Tax=Kitasatospora misakiensis TaxID=67330 RepID=A0ABW0XBT6_9ACTN